MQEAGQDVEEPSEEEKENAEGAGNLDDFFDPAVAAAEDWEDHREVMWLEEQRNKAQTLEDRELEDFYGLGLALLSILTFAFCFQLSLSILAWRFMFSALGLK